MNLHLLKFIHMCHHNSQHHILQCHRPLVVRRAQCGKEDWTLITSAKEWCYIFSFYTSFNDGNTLGSVYLHALVMVRIHSFIILLYPHCRDFIYFIYFYWGTCICHRYSTYVQYKGTFPCLLLCRFYKMRTKWLATCLPSRYFRNVCEPSLSSWSINKVPHSTGKFGRSYFSNVLFPLIFSSAWLNQSGYF